MDLDGLLRLMLRRWKIVVPMLLVVVALAVSVHRGGESVYEASGSVLLSQQPSDRAIAPEDVLDVAEVAAVVRLSAEARALVEFDESSRLSIEPTAENVLQATVVGGVAADVSSALTAVAQLIVEQVEAVQSGAGVAPDERVEAVVLTEDVVPVSQTVDGDTLFTATVGIMLDDRVVSRDNPYRPDRATGRLVQVAMESDAGRAEVAARSSDGITYSIIQDGNDPAAILEVAAYGPSGDEALTAFNVVVASIQDFLDTRQQQAGVPASSRIGVEVIALPEKVQNVSAPVSRAAAATLALGIVLTGLAAVLAENIGVRRSRSRHVSAKNWMSRSADSTEEAVGNEPSAVRIASLRQPPV